MQRASTAPGLAVRLWRWLFWAAVAAGVALALWPDPEHAQPLFAHADKVQHAVAFAVLVGLGWLARFRSLIRLGAGLLLLGAAIEVAQSFTATRTAEWADLLADGVGIGIGWMVVARIVRCSCPQPEKDGRQSVVD